MKFRAIAVIVLVFIAQNAAADWRDDLKENHTKRLHGYVDGLRNVLKSLVATKNTPAAKQCLEDANNKFDAIISRHSSEVDQCVAPPTEQPEAKACCDSLRRIVIKEVAVVGSNGTKCVIGSPSRV